MADGKFPPLDAEAIAGTRDALHAYSRVAGAWCKSVRKKRKHWWHASLRPSLYGLTTGVLYGSTDFEIEIDFASSRLCVRTCASARNERLDGQPSSHVATIVREALLTAGVDGALVPAMDFTTDESFGGYSADRANVMHRAIGSVTAALEDFRAGIREEKSPIQVWPHHFDLSMIWLPGDKVGNIDLDDEEHADKQMNFGFAFGDETIAEPYFYVTAYPWADALTKTSLPAGAEWRRNGFKGAVLTYDTLVSGGDPYGDLQALWSTLLVAGREQLREGG